MTPTEYQKFSAGIKTAMDGLEYAEKVLRESHLDREQNRERANHLEAMSEQLFDMRDAAAEEYLSEVSQG